MTIYLTTTGTKANVVINDIGAVTFTHPVVDLAVTGPDGFLSQDELANSNDMQAEVDAGSITLTVNSGANAVPISNTSNATYPFFKFVDRVTQVKTTSTDYNYLELTVDVPRDGNYVITWGVNIRYEKRGTQYIRYKVDIDNSIYVSCPVNSGWVEPEVWNNESSSVKGLDWTNARPLSLTAGTHTIRLKIGRTGSKAVIANFGFLQIEEK